MLIRKPEPNDIPRLRRLWQEVFGDGDAFLDDFFGTAFSPSRCLCAVEDQTAAAALYWIPCTCGRDRLAYVYAVATSVPFRGRGLFRQLMTQTHRILTAEGYAGAVLVPENGGLARMYERFGYRFFGSLREFHCTGGSDCIPLKKLEDAEFAALRRSLLPEGSVLQEEAGLAFLSSQLAFYAGEDILLACRREGDTLICAELLGNAAAAPGILAALSCREGTFRTPGEGRKFAMFRPLRSGAAAPNYFAFAYD